MPDDRLVDGIRVSGELVANRRPDEVGAIGVEALMKLSCTNKSI
jgi:hypothetical protein